jgi:sulfur carrier protein
MRLVINGEPREVAGAQTIEAVLQTLQIDPRLVVVEHNHEMVQRTELATRPVRSDDTLEVVRIVGGGS